MPLDNAPDKRDFKVVGTRPLRPDGIDKVTGRAKFGADAVAPGMLVGRVLRSPHAHAKIKKIDTSKAEKLAGVKAVRDARRLVSFLGPSWTVFDPSFAPTEIGDVGLDAGEIRLLQHVDGTKTLRDLVGLGPGDASHNAKLLYAFFVLKLISRRDMTSRTSVKKIHWSTSGGGYAPRS